MAETADMDRDGPMDTPSDWDSLSDRVRKAKRQQKTVLQQHRGNLSVSCPITCEANNSWVNPTAALLADRKDALTERPLDFDREEQTRKGETIKWLENHFGSDRSSSDSRDGDNDIEPTKKTYFKVTIKSTPSTPATTHPTPNPFPTNNTTLSHSAPITQFTTVVNNSSPAKIPVNPDRESSHPSLKVKQSPKTFFQGVTEWSERKEPIKPKVSTALRPTTLNTTAFQEELKGTLERNNRLKHHASNTVARGSREDLLSDSAYRLNTKTDRNYGSRGDLRPIKSQKEDLGYLSGSRNDVRMPAAGRRESHEDVYALSKKQSAYLHREDSGYVKDSREDVRYPRQAAREDSFIRDSGEEELRSFNKTAIQRDDSAYVSSSTYFTAPRSPKSQKSPKILTPDSGIRSPSPDAYDSEVGVSSRPTVPQRKRVLEKKMRLQGGSHQHLNRMNSQEPQPDYPRSRSVTPPTTSNGTSSGGVKKYQRTRFASQDRGIPSSSVTQSTQTLNRAGVTTNPGKSVAGGATKVGTVIGNSLRKLVGKIRSASAERKLKIKTNAAKRSPSPSSQAKANATHSSHLTNHSPGGSTYQQYNVIDGHIGNHNNNHNTHHHKHISGSKNHLNHIHSNNNNNNNNHVLHSKPPPMNRESSVVSSSSGIRRERSTALDRRGSSDLDMAVISPKQKYYLGEDPYGGSIFGKENRYEQQQQQQQRGAGPGSGHQVHHRSRRQAPRYPGDEVVSGGGVRHEKLMPVKSSSTLLFNGVANRLVKFTCLFWPKTMFNYLRSKPQRSLRTIYVHSEYLFSNKETISFIKHTHTRKHTTRK